MSRVAPIRMFSQLVHKRNMGSIGAGGGGQPPRKNAFDDTLKGHYVEYPDTSKLWQLVKEMHDRAARDGCYKFSSASIKGYEAVVFTHQINKGGADDIIKGGGLNATEGRFGSMAARAKAVSADEITALSLSTNETLYFTTLCHSPSNNEGLLVGVEWRIPYLAFWEAILVQDGRIKHIKDPNMKQ